MGHHSYYSLPLLKLVTGPECFGGLTPMQDHTEGFTVVFHQKNLARFDLHVIDHYGEGFIEYFIEFERCGEGGSDVIH